jgi:RimJ/RimL family protein N-acetyltransferase
MPSNFVLRPLSMADLDDLLAVANDYSIARYMTGKYPHPYTRQHGISFLTGATTQQQDNLRGIAIDGKLAGCIGIFPQDDIMCRNAELGYWLGAAYRGQGVATAAVQQMVHYGFSHFDISRIYARPFSNNPASQRVLEKAGFVLEARITGNILKFGEVLDELIYAVRRPAAQ